jgi:hypothetical protein
LIQPLLAALRRPTSVRNISVLGEPPAKHAEALVDLERSSLDDWHEMDPTLLTELLTKYRTRARDSARMPATCWTPSIGGS